MGHLMDYASAGAANNTRTADAQHYTARARARSHNACLFVLWCYENDLLKTCAHAGLGWVRALVVCRSVLCVYIHDV